MKISTELREAAEFLLESKDYVHITEIPNISYLIEQIEDGFQIIRETSSGKLDNEHKIYALSNILLNIKKELGE